MKPLKPRPELEISIRTKIIKALTLRGWYCKITHGNAKMSGIPDIFTCHRRFGQRWLEVKKPKGSRLTDPQYNVFHLLGTKNIGIWILTSDTDYEINKLQGPMNWYNYITTGGPINQPIKRIPKTGPEGKIQDDIIDKLTSRCHCIDPIHCRTHTDKNWVCIELFGCAFMSGFPDLYCAHRMFGARFIECKRPTGYSFTPAQIDSFPRLMAEGCGVWILTDASQTGLVFGPPNWYHFLK